jgi:hypothetical protein
VAGDLTAYREAIVAGWCLWAGPTEEVRQNGYDPTCGQGLCAEWAEREGSDVKQEQRWREGGGAVSDRSTHRRCRLRYGPMAGSSGQRGCQPRTSRGRRDWKR